MKTAFLFLKSNDVFSNLAVERKLLENPVADVLMMLWRNRSAVVISASQDLMEECRCEEALARNVSLARRASGGGAVYHDLGNLNFSFICRRDYYDVNRQLSVIGDALRQFGIVAEVAGRNDLGTGGLKFSGSAFYHLQQASCHHGTLLIQCDLNMMESLLTPGAVKLARHGAESVKARVVNLAQLAPEVTCQRMVEALKASFAAEYEVLPDENVEIPAVDESDKEKFRADRPLK